MNISGGAIGVLLGSILLIMLADVAPRVVIGLLALILVGLVLANSSRYTALLQNLQLAPKSTSN